MVLTPIKAIRKKCLDCSGGEHKEIEGCPITECPLYPYRFGKRPETAAKHSAKQNKNKEMPKFKRSMKKKEEGEDGTGK